eukprot:scaffold28586_cov107-Skeletonema_dohrnii-CCMP3373.AAC.15
MIAELLSFNAASLLGGFASPTANRARDVLERKLAICLIVPVGRQPSCVVLVRVIAKVQVTTRFTLSFDVSGTQFLQLSHPHSRMHLPPFRSFFMLQGCSITSATSYIVH